MNTIKEPEGVDFFINSKPLSKEEKLALSKFIRECKEKHSNKKLTGKEPQGKKVLSKKVRAKTTSKYSV